MKKTIAILTIVLLIAGIHSCKKTPTPTEGTVYLDLPGQPYSYFDSLTTFFNLNTGGLNIVNVDQVATLGRVLFYDTHLSVNNAISCGSCHKQSLAFADNAAFSTGFQGMPTKRNSIGITDVGQSFAFFWDGRENNIANLAIRPLTNHVEMGLVDSTSLTLKLAGLPYYSHLFINAYGDAHVTTLRISAAIGVFMQAITSDNTRLDQYNNGNTAALTAQELQGKFLFDTKYPCGSCHNSGNGGSGAYGGGGGATFLDIGLDAVYTDFGHGTITGLSSDMGTFKVPDLRNVAITAPYMHDGRYQTLSDVIDHYRHGIYKSPNLDSRLKDNMGNAMQMNITDDEKQAIIAFLGSLTDDHMISDPKFSNPFKVK